MFIRVKPTAKPNKKKVQICESIRQGEKVKQVIVQHVGISQNEEELESLKNLAKVIINKILEERQGPFLFHMEDIEELSPSEERVPSANSIKEPNLQKEKNLIVDLEDLSEQQRLVEGFHDVFGKLFNSCGFHQILNKKKSEVLKNLILARIASPSSKRASQEMLTAEFGIEIGLDRIYRMMDSLLEH